MKIADNIELLEISGNNGALYPVLAWDENEVVLIDAGLPGQLELIREAVSKAGFALEDITKLLITHQDMDHIGCAKQLSELGIQVLTHEAEAPYIQGEKTNVKLAAMEARLDQLSENEKAFYDQVKAAAPMFYVNISQKLQDGDVLDFCGGVRVIHTPGHTPGHAAFLFEKSNLVVCGDAANIADGSLIGPNPQYSQDMATATESFEKIKNLGADIICCYHGGVLQ